MEREKLIIGNSVELNGITIIPVMRMSSWCERIKGNLSFYGSIHPSHVVLVSNGEIKAFTINGVDISLKELIQEVPRLKKIVDSIKKQ